MAVYCFNVSHYVLCIGNAKSIFYDAQTIWIFSVAKIIRFWTIDYQDLVLKNWHPEQIRFLILRAGSGHGKTTVALSFSNLNRKTVQKNRFMYRLYRSKERMLGQSTSVCTVKIDKQIGKVYSEL